MEVLDLPAMRAAFADPCWHPAGAGFNVIAFDRTPSPCGRIEPLSGSIGEGAARAE